MFLFHTDKTKPDDKIRKNCTIVLFGKEYKIDILIEAEESPDLPDEFYNQKVDEFLDRIDQVQGALENFVKENYTDIIDTNYMCVDYGGVRKKSKTYQDYLKIVEDYNQGTMHALEIVLGNIEPEYFSLRDGNESYLYVLLSDGDDYGVDVEVMPEPKARYHE